MKKCNSCGFENDDDARFCAGCGASLADAVAAAPDGDAAAPANDDPYAAPADGAQAEQPMEGQPQKKGFKSTVVSVKDKTVSFEKRHSIILNAIVLACALVVIFVALFAPIKVVNYNIVFERYAGIIDSMDSSESTSKDDETVAKIEVSGHYVEVSQSIWQMIGALGYINGGDEKDVAEFEKQLEEVEEKVETEFAAWALTQKEPATEEEEEELEREAKNKQAELYAEYLSDVNLLGYAFVKNVAIMDLGSVSDGDGYDGLDETVEATMSYVDAMYSLAFGLAITILGIIAEIISLVYLIKAIIGMVKKKPQNKLFKYFGTMLGLSGSAVLLSMFAPYLAPGGGMLAIAVFMSIMYFVCGAFGSFVFGKDGLLLNIKRASIALFAMIAFFLLTTNIFALNSVEENYFVTYEQTLSGPMGYGWFSFFNIFASLTGFGGSDMPDEAIVSVVNAAAPSIVAYVTYLFMFFAVIFAFRAYQRTLKKLAFGDVSKSSCTGFAITAAVFMLLAIISSMALTNMMASVIFNMASETNLVLEDIMQSSWSVRAQVWVSMIFFLILAIFNLVFKPKSKNPAVQEGQQM